MIVSPMVRNSVCLNAHPTGCRAETEAWIARAAGLGRGKAARDRGPTRALVIGCSTGYGLATRAVAAFAYGAATVGVSFEREPGEKRTASPGWYANRAFDAASARAGIACRTIEADAFSKEAKARAVEASREIGGPYDLVIYSLASPVRMDPETGILYRSVLKPLGAAYEGLTADMATGALSRSSIEPATDEEARQTVKVMGGEDWALWIDALRAGGALARGAFTVAYSYVGPESTKAIYRRGTIGLAKDHLEATAKALGRTHADLALGAYVSVNKALVTRASAVIPVISVYVAALYSVMKAKGLHEGCVEQISRLFSERLYAGGSVTAAPETDGQGRIRLDDYEMDADVQTEVMRRMAALVEGGPSGLLDMAGYRQDFMRVHGFDVPGVDYSADVELS